MIGTTNNPGTVLMTSSEMSAVEEVMEVDETDIPSVPAIGSGTASYLTFTRANACASINNGTVQFGAKSIGNLKTIEASGSPVRRSHVAIHTSSIRPSHTISSRNDSYLSSSRDVRGLLVVIRQP